MRPHSNQRQPLQHNGPPNKMPTTTYPQKQIQGPMSKRAEEKKKKPGKEGEGWLMTDDVVEGTRKRYLEALEMLTGEGL